jgi:hypothetical protein
MGDRVIIAATNRAAKVTAELPRDHYEVEPETMLDGTAAPHAEREDYYLSELREA